MSSYGKLVSPTVRFAPSPTGRICIGNARTAVFTTALNILRAQRFDYVRPGSLNTATNATLLRIWRGSASFPT